MLFWRFERSILDVVNDLVDAGVPREVFTNLMTDLYDRFQNDGIVIYKDIIDALGNHHYAWSDTPQQDKEAMRLQSLLDPMRNYLKNYEAPKIDICSKLVSDIDDAVLADNAAVDRRRGRYALLRRAKLTLLP